jgi:alanine-glyoxylate transaminase / serine-glyoxylate transaminase / serine-pyruvate transaminase
MKPTDDVLLLTPGPTPIHPRAQAALCWPMRGHMDPEVFAFNDRIASDLKRLYGTGPGAFTSLLSGTGSLGMEAGLANLLEPGERVLVLSNGAFGERTVEMATRLGCDVHALRFDPGTPVEVGAAARAARSLRPALITVVHGETSTGVLNPVPELGAVARDVDALYSVDAVTTVGMLPFAMEAWGVDYAYTGSQKCLSAPPGVAPVAISERGMTRIAQRRLPVASWYADALGMRRYWEDGSSGRSYHHTVPVQLHWALGEALSAALEEGIDARAERARRIGAAALTALQTAGFEAYVPAAHRLPTVLTVVPPASIDEAALRKALRSGHGVTVAGGLGPTAGRVWRLGLMGENARDEHYERFFEALEAELGEAGLVERFVAAGQPAAA